MTITIAEAAAELASRFETEVPKVADMPCCFGRTVEGPPLEQGKQGPRMPVFSPANEGESPPEFLLSMARTFRIPGFTKRLLQAVTAGALRVRDSDGLLLPEGTEGTESSWVDIAEAQAALEKTGARFVPDDATANSGTPEKAAPPAPVQRHRFQEAEILRAIKELGLTAKALLKPRPGKSGVKAQVRAKLKMNVGVFDKAWERLRAQGEIKDAS